MWLLNNIFPKTQQVKEKNHKRNKKYFEVDKNGNKTKLVGHTKVLFTDK